MNQVNLVEKFAPIVILHKDEKAYPCSVDFALLNSKLVIQTGEHQPTKDAFQDHKINSEDVQAKAKLMYDLYPASSQHGKTRTSDAYLSISSNCFPGFAPANKDYTNLQKNLVGRKSAMPIIQPEAGIPLGLKALEQAPVYCNIRAGPSEHILDIVYHFFYNANPAEVRILGLFGISKAAHVGDWEHCTMRVDISDPANPCLVGVYFGQHGDGQYITYTSGKLTTKAHDLDRVYIWSAYASHASYPSSSTNHIALGLFNDYCSNDGPVWDTKNNIVLLDTTQAIGSAANPFWLHSCLMYGKNGTSGLLDKGYFYQPEPMSYTIWNRLFCWYNDCCMVNNTN